MLNLSGNLKGYSKHCFLPLTIIIIYAQILFIFTKCELAIHVQCFIYSWHTPASILTLTSHIQKKTRNSCFRSFPNAIIHFLPQVKNKTFP